MPLIVAQTTDKPTSPLLHSVRGDGESTGVLKVFTGVFRTADHRRGHARKNLTRGHASVRKAEGQPLVSR